jgi:hypothetical protein
MVGPSGAATTCYGILFRRFRCAPPTASHGVALRATNARESACQETSESVKNLLVVARSPERVTPAIEGLRPFRCLLVLTEDCFTTPSQRKGPSFLIV